MNRKAWKSSAIAGVVASALLPMAQAEPVRVGDFSLIDHQGDLQHLSRLANNKAVVIISQANTCTENVDQLHRYKHLRTTWEKQGVKFLMLNSSKDDDLTSIRRTASTYGIDFPIMYDETQLVAESLKVAKAGEVLVIEPNTKSVLYHGPLDRPPAPERDDGSSGAAKAAPQPLADAISKAVSGSIEGAETVNVPVAKGCDLSFPVATAQAKNVPDYTREVGPLLKENCAVCHVQGGIAPFAMNSYDIVKGFSPMIKEVLLTKRMPPAQVDPHVNHFENANYIANGDMQKIVHWIDAGSPRGEGKDPLLAVKPLKSEWQLGKPDLIVDVPAFDVPATGVIDYFNHTIDLPFTEDKYVRAVQFIPGDRRVLHHLLSYISSPDFSRGEPITEENVRDFLEGYAPGKTDATQFPKDTGVFVQKGHKLVLQMHYTPMGKAVTDKTRVGLYFHDKPPRYKYLTHPVSFGGKNLVIPPGEQDHRMTASYVFPQDSMLYAMRPHMHYRGKAFRFRAIYPDGSSDVLINVPNYNFAWQPTYRLSQPRMMPAGTRIVTEGAYDNSKFNLYNPDPTTTVKGGPQSWDEMFIGYLTYTIQEKEKVSATR